MNLVLTLLFVLHALIGQGTASWRDPPPHEVRCVTVDSSVTLEILDWGGAGRPILFVGCYLTGHVYDDIAPKLTDQCHVYAVTRRGVGASDRPAAGYDPQRRAADVLEVMGALGMEKPILVGIVLSMRIATAVQRSRNYPSMPRRCERWTACSMYSRTI